MSKCRDRRDALSAAGHERRGSLRLRPVELPVRHRSATMLFRPMLAPKERPGDRENKQDEKKGVLERET